jgi:hypothetical protein
MVTHWSSGEPSVHGRFFSRSFRMLDTTKEVFVSRSSDFSEESTVSSSVGEAAGPGPARRRGGGVVGEPRYDRVGVGIPRVRREERGGDRAVVRGDRAVVRYTAGRRELDTRLGVAHLPQSRVLHPGEHGAHVGGDRVEPERAGDGDERRREGDHLEDERTDAAGAAALSVHHISREVKVRRRGSIRRRLRLNAFAASEDDTGNINFKVRFVN